MNTLNTIWFVKTSETLDELTISQRSLVLAYEYILSDQWGKGTPDPVYKELDRMRRPKKPKMVLDSL